MITIFHMVIAVAVIVGMYELARAAGHIRRARRHSRQRRVQLAYYSQPDSEREDQNTWVLPEAPVETPVVSEPVAEPVAEPVSEPALRVKGIARYMPVKSDRLSAYSNFDLIELTDMDEFDFIEELRNEGVVPRCSNYDNE